MGNKSKIILLSILVLGLFLRMHNATTWPRLGATFDEYAWTWQGMNIIQKGIPISWSPHTQYENANSIIYQQTHFRLVTPFLEHPPLFGFVAGSFAIINGAGDMLDLNIVHIRPLAIILGILSIFLVFSLTRQLYDVKIGLLSALLYATVPTIVIGSRIVQNENFFIPLFLLALLFASKYLQQKNKLYRNIAIIICSLLILAKIPWVAAGITLIGIFIFFKKYTDAVITGIGIFTAFILFALYGAFYDWGLFIELWKFQAARYDLTFTSIFALFQKPFLIDRYYIDGWIYFGWFAFFLLLIKDVKKNIFIIAPTVSYFLIFLAGIPDEAGHGWYRYPFYPFLIISIALFLREYFAKNFLLTFFFLIIIGTSLFGNTWEKVFGFSYIVFRLSIISWMFLLITYSPFMKNRVKFAEIVSYLWFGILILMNIWGILIYNEQ